MASTCLKGKEREVVDELDSPDLPSELLQCITNDMDQLDCIAVSEVRASWHSCVQELYPFDLPFEVPRLLIRRPGQDGELTFFCLKDRKIVPVVPPTRLRAGRCCGHITGWLVMASDSERAIVLWNTISGRSINVPSPPVFPVKKIVLSGLPTSEDWVAAMLGRTGTIALLQPSVSDAWMIIGIAEGQQHGGFIDMAFWRDQLCALGHDGAVFKFRADARECAGTVSLLRDPELRVWRGHRGWQLFLVEMAGELLVVRKLYSSLDQDEVDWKVEVLVLNSPEERKWDFLAKTPDRALFVGSVFSGAVRVALDPESGLRDSCVYFARREVEMLWPHAISEYSMDDDDMTCVPITGGHATDVEPVWIFPLV